MNPIKKSASSPLLNFVSVGGGGGAAACNFTSISLSETMRRRASATFLFVFISVFLCASFSLYSSRNPIYSAELIYRPPPNLTTHHAGDDFSNLVIQESHHNHPTRHVSSVQDSNIISSVSILMADWEVLVIVSPVTDRQLLSGEDFACLFPNNATSPAKFSGILPSTNRTTFKCFLPRSSRRRSPFFAPILKRSSDKEFSVPWPTSPPQVLLRSNNLVYESFSTDDDVVLFVKGLNNRQGINRSPLEFNCVFIDQARNNTVKTAVTSSMQEVFRCRHPELSADESMELKVSVEILEGNRLVPSVAYYTPGRKIEKAQRKYKMCATTMVYNVAKFLREWVTYYSKIGVEKFILYDNDSDDDLITVIKWLNDDGYNVERLLWIWPKAQEAGFSHAALMANFSCNWMAYVDVDEFIFSPSWENSTQPSDQMLKSLLPSDGQMIGEVWIKCSEFGPSQQRSHPAEGVMQGYDCRRRLENRHKSIVLLQAIDHSLLNVIHHFQLNGEYRIKHLGMEKAVVNHYKYQAWTEFKAKFRRRVSAYVVDWMKALNPMSKDRTPGLGYAVVEPPGWENKFCEVRDERLKLLTQRWFGTKTETGYRMAWQG